MAPCDLQHMCLLADQFEAHAASRSLDEIERAGRLLRAAAAELEQAQHTPLLRQALLALEYHREQTRPIERTDQAIAALRAATAAGTGGPYQWSEDEAVRVAHAAGFAGTCWTMSPYELAHLLGMVGAWPNVGAKAPT